MNPNLLYDIPEVTLGTSGNVVSLCWEFSMENGMWDTVMPKLKSLDKYRKSVNKAMGEGTVSLLLQSQKAAKDTVPPDGYVQGDNWQLVRYRHLGQIRQMNALESHFMDYQAFRYSMYERPSQFQCFILKKDTLGVTWTRVYFTAGDKPLLSRSRMLMASVEEAIAEGWYMYGYLHNHTGRSAADVMGDLTPDYKDVADLQLLKNQYGLRHAFITNGFKTLEIDASDFNSFYKEDPAAAVTSN